MQSRSLYHNDRLQLRHCSGSLARVLSGQRPVTAITGMLRSCYTSSSTCAKALARSPVNIMRHQKRVVLESVERSGAQISSFPSDLVLPYIRSKNSDIRILLSRSVSCTSALSTPNPKLGLNSHDLV